MTENTDSNPLEQALSAAKDNDQQSIRRALRAFVQSRVFVKLDQPWDGKSFPRSDMRLLFVSDGDNRERPMLAVFTSKAFCDIYAQAAAPFDYVAEVDAAWACLGVPGDAGIMVNPNSVPSFRIGPEVAGILREAAEKDVAEKSTPRSVTTAQD